MVNFTHPANRTLVANFQSRNRGPRDADFASWGGNERGNPREADPAKVENPYYTLGTHPDIVERLWDELGGVLPVSCRWILYGRPVLVHPASGVVFGFAGGTHTYGMRLPPVERADAIRAGAKTIHEYPAYPELKVAASRLDLADLGPEWVFGGWLKGEEDWCRAAFEYAGK